MLVARLVTLNINHKWTSFWVLILLNLNVNLDVNSNIQFTFGLAFGILMDDFLLQKKGRVYQIGNRLIEVHFASCLE